MPTGKQFSYISGEKLKNRFHPDNEDTDFGYQTMDGYKVESAIRGPRAVFDPTGSRLDDAESVNHAISIIQKHRLDGAPSEPPVPTRTIGRPPTGHLARKIQNR